MALTFTAASSKYLRIASASITAAPLTMACWFYPTDFTNFQVLMSINNSGSSFNNFRLDFRGDAAGNKLSWLAWDAGAGPNGVDSTAGASGTSAWYHAAAVAASASSRTVYFNGGNSAANTVSVTPSGLNDTEIGAYRFGSSAPGSFFDGYMAEVAMWSAALTAAEVAKLASGVPCDQIRPANLVYYIPGIADILDRKGTAWTNNNSVGFTAHPKQIWRPTLLRPRAPFTGTSPPPPPPSTYIGARFQMIGSGIQQFSGGRAA